MSHGMNREQFENHISDKVEMALVYLADGAFHTAAERLAQAAAEVSAVAAGRDAAMQGEQP